MAKASRSFQGFCSVDPARGLVSRPMHLFEARLWGKRQISAQKIFTSYFMLPDNSVFFSMPWSVIWVFDVDYFQKIKMTFLS